MKKKSIILFFLLLANMVMLAHAVIPHHHHEDGICVVSLFHHGHSQDTNHNRDCDSSCKLNKTDIVPCETQKKDFTLQKTQHDFSLLHTYVLWSNRMIKKVKQPSYALDYADKIPICCVYVNKLLGLRAPPAIA